MKYKVNIIYRFYRCNCGDLFVNRFSLVKHIKDKKKGKYKGKHFAGDYVRGNKLGLVAFVHKFDEVK